MQYTFPYASPLGRITLASDGESLTGLWFNGQKHFGTALLPEAEERALPVFALTERWLDAFFRGVSPEPAPPVSLRGSPFRLAVWEALLTIPRGETRTYGELARTVAERLGRKRMSAQAVGGAVGHNPISLIVPCHRVVGADGSLTGYAGGLERKLRLLELEGADLRRLYVPGQGRRTAEREAEA